MLALQQPDTVRKIAVVRANGIGDYLFSVPALNALRCAYPEAEIVFLGKKWHEQSLRGRPGPIDRVVAIPTYGGVSAEPGALEDDKELGDFFEAMRAERFDLALQLHGGGRYSNPFTSRLGARYTVGMRAKDAPPLDRYIPYYYFQPEVLRYLEVVSLVGAQPTQLVPTFPLTASDYAEVAALNLKLETPLVVLHPGATDPRRRWSTESFAAVGKAFAERGAQVAVIGSRNERDLISVLMDALAPYSAVDVCERLTLGGLAALLARSRVVIANDSGPLHLADAVGTKTVGIYWCGNLINGGPTTRRRHRPAISWRLDCPVCDKNTLTHACDHRASFVADVPVDEVLEAALELYGEHVTHA